MALLQQFTFVDSTGLTLITTTGTITFNQLDAGRVYVRVTRTVSPGPFDSLGFHATVGVTNPPAGSILYWDARMAVAFGPNGAMAGIRDSSGLTVAALQEYNETFFDGVVRDCGVNLSPGSGFSLLNIWFNYRMILDAGPIWTVEAHVDDGTPQEQIATWTTMKIVNPPVCHNPLTSTNFFMVNNAQDSFDISRMNFTDDGIITPPAADGGMPSGSKWAAAGRFGLRPINSRSFKPRGGFG